MTDSIIVYRNPLEAALWENATGDIAFPIMCGLAAIVAIFVYNWMT